jgi:drug/metabolite transporter (DMT)-like permease
VSTRAKTHLALISIVLLFGMSYVLTKIILHEIRPEIWALYRLLIASASMLPFALRKDATECLKLPRFWACAFFGIAFNQLLWVAGLALTTPSHSALINASIPAFTLVFAVIASTERFRLNAALGIVCAIAGVAVLFNGRSGSSERLGDLLTLANTLSYSFFLVIGRPLARREDALKLTALYLLAGAAMLLPYAIACGHWTDGWATLIAAPLSLHAIMIFVAISSTTVAYGLNNWALRHARSSQVAMYVPAQPLIAGGLSSLIIHQPLSPAFIPAFAMISSGIWIASRPGEDQQAQEQGEIPA